MKKLLWEVRETNVREIIPIFVRLQCWVLPALVFEGYDWYFGSLHPAFEMSCDTEYLEKNSFWFFSETWSSSFWIVCICFDDFRTNRPKNNGRSHRKENNNFPKRRWVRSRNVFLSSGGLVASVVTKKAVLRTSSDLSTWNNTCFLFKCRVTFRLRQTSKATFGTLARYILRLRCLVLSNTYKNSFCFLSKTETFQNDVEYVPEMSFWALLGWILWLWIKKLLWELAEISLHETIRVFCSNAESRFGCAIFRTLRSVLWLFTSCVWDVLRYRILIKKTAFDFFGNVVFEILDCVQLFWWFSYKPSEKQWAFSSKGKHQLSKMTLSTFQKCLLELCFAFFFGCNKNMFWGLSTWNNTCFLFKCRVTFWLCYFSNATFGTLALYILRLRCLAIPNT